MPDNIDGLKDDGIEISSRDDIFEKIDLKSMEPDRLHRNGFAGVLADMGLTSNQSEDRKIEEIGKTGTYEGVYEIFLQTGEHVLARAEAVRKLIKLATKPEQLKDLLEFGYANPASLITSQIIQKQEELAAGLLEQAKTIEELETLYRNTPLLSPTRAIIAKKMFSHFVKK